jgi:hypothetical protein
MDKKILEKLIKEDKSLHKIAAELKCSKTNVEYWLKKFGLSTNFKKYNIKIHKCTTCGETDETKFYGKKKNICGRCQTAYNNEAGRKKKKKAVEHKGGQCKKCGYDKCINALEFHHRDPSTKNDQWKTMSGWKWSRILKELHKCDLLCANCHREVHYETFSSKYGSEPIKKIPKKTKPLITKRCKQCNKEFTTKKNKRKFCSVNCGKIFARKVIRPSKKKLKSIIDSGKPFTRIGKDFGVSDNAVRKWAKQYDIL